MPISSLGPAEVADFVVQHGFRLNLNEMFSISCLKCDSTLVVATV